MFDQNFRIQTGKLFKPLVLKTGLVKLDPDLVTFIGFLFGIGSAGFVLVGQNFFGLIFWGVNRVIDGLDGEIARFRSTESNASSEAGGYLDITLDFVIYAAIPIAFGFAVDEKQLWMIIAFLLASFYLNTITWTYLAALIEKAKSNDVDLKTSINMPSGIIEGAETIFFYSAFFIFFNHLKILMAALGILVTLTAFIRFVRSYFALKNLEIQDSKSS